MAMTTSVLTDPNPLTTVASPASSAEAAASVSRPLLRAGLLLFLLGLVTGFLMPLYANPRMGLASHLEGVMNGMFLVLLGLAWGHLRMAERARRWLARIAVYGTYANWVATLLAAVWGAGAMMPLAAGGRTGSAAQEAVVAGLLWSLSLAMLAVGGVALWGLRGAAVGGCRAGHGEGGRKR
jgi:hydroxylaminobenzene mutase